MDLTLIEPGDWVLYRDSVHRNLSHVSSVYAVFFRMKTGEVLIQTASLAYITHDNILEFCKPL